MSGTLWDPFVKHKNKGGAMKIAPPLLYSFIYWSTLYTTFAISWRIRITSKMFTTPSLL